MADVATAMQRPRFGAKNGWGDRLREARERTGLTQLEIAKEAGIALSTYNRWERGITVPGPQLRRVIEVLNARLDRRSVTFDWILHGDEDGE